MKRGKAIVDRLVLGLDIGTNSVGWAVMLEDRGNTISLVDAGVRVFDAGVEGTQEEIEAGRDKPRATDRREKRLLRRQHARRTERLHTLASVLQQGGLLPDGDISTPEARKALFDELDTGLRAKHQTHDILPYILRARALDHALTPHEFGRAVFHLAQKRGFLSNRKTEAREQEENKKEGVKEYISELNQRMLEQNCRTLGEYYCRLADSNEKIRGGLFAKGYSDRSMVQQEFDMMWDAQREHIPALGDEEYRKRVRRAVFFQRPLKGGRHLVGRCELEPARRAPRALLSSQRFRLLQKVNDPRVITDDGKSRKLNSDERSKLAALLQIQAKMKFTAVRKNLDIKKAKINLEHDGEKEIIGNITAARLVKVFGKDVWNGMSPAQQDDVVHAVRSVRKRETLARMGREKWGLTPEQAQKLSEVSLEDGHITLSQAAVKKLLPLMEQGMSFATARKEIYGQAPPPKPLDLLPQLLKNPHMPEVTNPTVRRALTELRKVVNALIRKYGKPFEIRVELARDLKRNRKLRNELSRRNNANRRAREKAADELLKEAAAHPSFSGWTPKRSDIEKWQLAQECKFECPYTGRRMSFASLFVNPEFDVEHIVPFSRCMDNSFLNKTLCYGPENRNVKRKQTPWEAYGGTPRWDDIINRVKNFERSPAAQKKLERFQRKDIEGLDDFTSRQLIDTQYASRLAMRYLGLLYGAGIEGIDPTGRRPVQAGRGQITAHQRNVLGLNSILNDGDIKTRNDHRHHAVDAVCAALQTPGMVKAMSHAAAGAEKMHRHGFDNALVPEPWPGFKRDVRAAVARINVSHRPNRKANAALHDDSYYSSKEDREQKGNQFVSIRRALPNLKPAEVDKIVDPAVRAAVQNALAGKTPADAFKESENFPYLTTRDGRRIPIKSARISVNKATTPIGRGARQRHVLTNSNHHIEIFEVKDDKGRTKWDGRVISTLEAMDRVRRGSRENPVPVVDRTHEKARFAFSLCNGDMIQLLMDGKVSLFRVRGIFQEKTGSRIAFVHINDARQIKEIRSSGQYYRMTTNKLMSSGCKKVNISPIGDVTPAND